MRILKIILYLPMMIYFLTAEYPVTTESDCAGNDHWGGYTYSLAECQQFCDQQPDCVAFVHKDMCWYSEHSCWPKISCDDVTTNSEGWNVYKKQKIPGMVLVIEHSKSKLVFYISINSQGHKLGQIHSICHL